VPIYFAAGAVSKPKRLLPYVIGKNTAKIRAVDFIS